MASDEPDPCVTCGGNGDNDDDRSVWQKKYLYLFDKRENGFH